MTDPDERPDPLDADEEFVDDLEGFDADGTGDGPAEDVDPAAALFARLDQDTVRPWSWLELPADEAEVLMELLARFVEDFNLRYAWSPKHLVPACWPAHGALVEELTTLWWSRYCAFDAPGAKIGDAMNWHDKWLPGFLKRMTTWLDGTEQDCRAGQHSKSEQWPAQSQAAANLTDEMRRLTARMAAADVAAIPRRAAPRRPEIPDAEGEEL